MFSVGSDDCVVYGVGIVCVCCVCVCVVFECLA